MKKTNLRYCILPFLAVLVLGLAHLDKTDVFWFIGMLPAFLLCSLFAGTGVWLEHAAHLASEETTIQKFRDYIKCHTSQTFLTVTDAAIMTTVNAFLFRVLPAPCPYGLFLIGVALCFLSLGFLSRLVFPYFKERRGQGKAMTDLLLVTIPLLLILTSFLYAILFNR